MVRNLLVVFFCLLFSASLFAQPALQSVGMRGGFENGISLRLEFNEKELIEGIVALRWGGTQFNLLYQRYFRHLADTERLNWFYGGGIHAGIHTRDNRYRDRNYRNEVRNQYASLGLDLIIGLEADLGNSPFSISADWKPALNFTGNYAVAPLGGGLTLRYRVE